MKNELELRILNVNIEEIENKLISLGASKVGAWNYIRYVYDAKPIDDNKWIRLRSDGEKTTLTYKNFSDDSISGVQELEIEVSDLEKTKEFLEILGYTYRSVQQNKRIRYMYEDVEIDIDIWPHLNPFVEVEGPTEEKVTEVIDLLKECGSEVTGKNVQSLYEEAGYTKADLNDLRF